jgi:hypothetical protein
MWKLGLSSRNSQKKKEYINGILAAVRLIHWLIVNETVCKKLSLTWGLAVSYGSNIEQMDLMNWDLLSVPNVYPCL